MKKLELVLWFRCNCRCEFCAVDAPTAAQAMSTAAALARLRRARRAGALAVDFGGGEPTLRRDLPELARAAKKLGYRSIGLKTNGLLLAYPERVEALLEAGVARFAIPVWGDSPREHDELSRVPGSFDMAEMAMKHVLDLGGELQTDVLLTTRTVPRLKELLASFAAIGARRFQLWLYSLFGAAGARPDLLPDLATAGRAAAAAHEALAPGGVRISTTHVPSCFLRPHENLYASVAGQELVIATPGGSFPAEDSPFEAGVKTAACAPCARRAECGGLRPEYLERFPDEKTKPFQENAHVQIRKPR